MDSITGAVKDKVLQWAELTDKTSKKILKVPT
jgi:hypothetical protein